MRNFRIHRILAAALACWLCGLSADALAQAKGGFFSGRKMAKPAGLIGRQEKAIVNKDLVEVINSENSYAVISLSKQRLYLLTGDQVYIDSPISSGKRGHSTPQGTFSIMEKDANHRSSIYGNFVDRRGRVVRSGISSKIDSAPSGTRYLGAPMKWFCRLTGSGVGFHVGVLPGYPASHGCIRLPDDIAPLIYQKVKVGTRVRVEA
ncbi:MAG: L,D-transpeptidase family protein [Chthoniobacteraceae bacterium]